MSKNERGNSNEFEQRWALSEAADSESISLTCLSYQDDMETKFIAFLFLSKSAFTALYCKMFYKMKIEKGEDNLRERVQNMQLPTTKNTSSASSEKRTQ